MDGKIPVARPIEDVVADCHKIFISKLPGNRMVGAAWGAFCEAWREYEFAKGIITTEEIANRHSDTYLWLHHGKYQAYAGVIRKIADGLGVENVVWREASNAPSVPGIEPGDRAGSGDEDQPG